MSESKGEWTKEFFEYCEECGFEGDPDGMVAYDAKKYPGGCMTGFICSRSGVIARMKKNGTYWKRIKDECQ